MDSSDKEQELARCFAALVAAIGACENQKDTLDRVRDALDRKADKLASHHQGFVEGSLSIVAVAYETENTQLLQARHRDIDAVYAIKTVHPERRHDAHLIQQLRREAEIGLSLRHPLLQETCALIRMGDGRPGLLQPWAPMTLGSWLSGNRIGISQISALIASMLQAVGVMHARGLVHGDVTASNILLPHGNLDSPRLGDFGITLKIGEKPLDVGARYAGSPGYAPPEQMAGGKADPRHDIYAIGKLAERLLVAEDDVTSALSRFVETCTLQDADKRPSSAEEAANLLR